MKKLITFTTVLLLLYVGSIYGVEDRVVAIVNNEAVTKAELDSYINLIKLQIGYDGWREFEMTEEKALENLIEDRLVLQEARRKEIKVAERLIDSRVENLKRRLGSEVNFSEFLSGEGISLSELRKRFEEKMLSEKLINMQVRSRIFVSPKEVTQFYQEHIDDFHLPESVRSESIFVKDADVALKIYDRLKEGANFVELQEKYSEKASMGLVRRGELLKDIEDVIFGLETEEFSEPKKISGGYYIFLAKEKMASSNKQLVEVQNYIYNVIADMKFNAKLRELLDKLKSNSYIVIKDE